VSARGERADEDDAAARPHAAFVLGATLAGPAGAGIGVLALGVALGRDFLAVIQGCGPWFWVLAGATVLGAAACGGLGWAAARGSRLPVALALGAATLPWIAGVASMRWALAPLFREHDARLSTLPPDTSFALAVIADTASIRLLGTGLGAGLAIGLALALGIAAVGRRTQRVPADRGVGLPAAVPVALGLGWLAAIAAVESQTALRQPLATLARIGDFATHARAVARGVAAFAMSSELRVVGSLGCAAAALALAIWSMRRGARGPREIAAGAAALGVVLGCAALDHTAIARTARDAGARWPPPWRSVAGFAPVALQGGRYDQVLDALVTRDAIHVRGRPAVAVETLRGSAGMDALVRSLRHALATAPSGAGGRDASALAVAVDERAGGLAIRTVTDAAIRAGAGSLVLVGQDARSARGLERAAPLYAALLGQPVTIWVEVGVAAGSEDDGHDPRLRATVGRGAVVHVVARPGATGAFDVDLRRPTPAWDLESPELARDLVVWLFVPDDATGQALLSTIDRIVHRAPRVRLAVEPAPPPSFDEPAYGVLRGTMVGDAYGTPAIDYARIPRRAR